MKTDYSPVIVSGQNCLSSSSIGSPTMQAGQPKRLHVDIVPPPTDGTHIRVSKHVANKFKEIGTYNETADRF